MSKHKPVIALTPGEPAGIGPDLAIKLAQHPSPADRHIVVIADHQTLLDRAVQLGQSIDLPEWHAGTEAGISLLSVPAEVVVRPGHLDARNSAYVLQTLERAVDGCLSGEFDALVTGPVHKGVINESGIHFTGHTEFLADRCQTDQVVMMLATDNLRVALATTHIPLSRVSDAITQPRLEQIIRILQHDLIQRFGIAQPRILVCGLNPHAGESGYLGHEEIDTIAPVIDRLEGEGLRIRGPLPADTAFTPRLLADADVVLAMYHDQGLPVLKYAGFGQAVNITLGLPIIRTSVDHGTALERAGTGDIESGSLLAAIDMAERMVQA
ncbi:MAG: 4-hydroxythreonine-4-phosphate dehydrogenase [Acidithiobacillales bacterium SG8_45]|jgi:4-hydroxythreonine-4-phosphate dehydrogenase|nr:MAG: 4-hydroxythreonine-4-phosphate dehydrogenase [Acidithiobacillales bacterium SG8_45]